MCDLRQRRVPRGLTSIDLGLRAPPRGETAKIYWAWFKSG
jgi:hypothetical protein